jgi:transposase
MTSTMGQDQIVKVDRIGRIKTPRERREALLAEFDRSGMSGQQFAKWAGIKHCTFITWVQKRRRKGAPGQAEDKPAPTGAKSTVQWVEAVLEKATAKKSEVNPNTTVMIVQGPGGVRLELSEERHVRKRPTRYLLTLVQMVYVVQLKMAHMYHRI